MTSLWRRRDKWLTELEPRAVGWERVVVGRCETNLPDFWTFLNIALTFKKVSTETDLAHDRKKDNVCCFCRHRRDRKKDNMRCFCGGQAFRQPGARKPR